jgi:hypothetical protein
MSEKLASEKLVVSAPMSFQGSAARIWKLTDREGSIRWVFILVSLGLIAVVWCFVLIWYVIFGLLLVPYRLIRRGSRKRKMESLRHRELLGAVEKKA